MGLTVNVIILIAIFMITYRVEVTYLAVFILAHCFFFSNTFSNVANVISVVLS